MARQTNVAAFGGPKRHVEGPPSFLRHALCLRVEAWENINHYIFAFCFSRNPQGLDFAAQGSGQS